MTQLVELPDGQQLEFPDGMSQDAMASAIKHNFPNLEKESVTEGELKGAARPARMTQTIGGQSLLADDREAPTPEPSTPAPRDFTAANELGKKRFATDTVGLNAAERQQRVESEKANEIAAADPLRNIIASVKGIPAGEQKIAGGLIQAAGEAAGGQTLEDITAGDALQVAGPKRDPALDAGFADKLADTGKVLADEAVAREKELNTGLKPGLATQAIQTAIQSVAVMAPSMLTGGLAGAAEGGMFAAGKHAGERALFGTMFASQFGDSYSDGRQAGMTPGQAGAYATVYGAIEVGTEFAPMRALFKNDTNLMKKAANFFAVEVPQELLATALEFAVDKASIKPDMTWQDLKDQLVMTVLSTPLAGAAQVGAAHAAHGLIHREPDRNEIVAGEIQSAVDATSFAPGSAEAEALRRLQPDARTIDPRETVKTIVAAPTVDDAIAAAQAAVAAPVSVEAPLPVTVATPETAAVRNDEQLYTDEETKPHAEHQERINAALAGATGVTVVDGVAHLEAAPVLAVDPASLPDTGAPSGDREQISKGSAAALSELYEKAGKQVVFYRDDPALPDGFVLRANAPDTVFLSDNPLRAGNFVAGHEFSHTLEDNTVLHQVALKLINEGITPAGLAYAEARFGRSAPSDPVERRAFLINEVAADLGGWALNDPTFLPKVITAIQAKHGQTVAKKTLAKLISGLKAAIARVRALFRTEPDMSAMVVSNLEAIHGVLAQLHAEAFTSQLEKEKAKVAAMKGTPTVQESAKSEMVATDALTNETIDDLGMTIAGKTGLDEDDIRQELYVKGGFVDPFVVPRLELKPTEIVTKKRAYSEKAIKQYQEQLKTSQPPPIVVRREGGKYMLEEGGHRLQAAVRSGAKTIQAVDATELLKMDWAAYLRGEPVEGPLQSKVQQSPKPVAKANKEEYAESHGPDQRARAAAQSEELQRTVAGGRPAEGWARATRIRGADGQPRSLYRGAATPLDASHFEVGALGRASGNASSGLGVWFTVSQSEAQSYGSAESFKLDIRNPKVIKVEDLPGFDSVEQAHAWREGLRAAGHDGLVVSAKHLGGRVHVVAFSPEQVVRPNEPQLSPKTPEFKRWFAGSKVVDANGEPLVVYHGTTSEKFDVFDVDSSYEEAVYFTPNIEIARSFSEDATGESGDFGHIVSAYLSIKNPKTIDAAEVQASGDIQGGMKELFDAARAEGHDGAILTGVKEFGGTDLQYVVFRPEQIKLTTNERPTNSPKISESPKGLAAETKLKNPSRQITSFLRHLTPRERSKISDRLASAIIDHLESFPSAAEMAAVAHAGRAKRGWYARSAKTISDVFGPDAPHFAALLAALSPQTGVEDNLVNALNVWQGWLEAGRPTDRKSIIAILADRVQGNKGEGSVLNAWINNTERALSYGDLSDITLSGPKVNSFWQNLLGDVLEVTNDTWMANYAGVMQTIFGGVADKWGIAGKGSGYLAMNVRVREAAAILSEKTGETWTPAEVQETIWSWAKATYEHANAAGSTRSAVELVNDDAITADLIRSTPDFGTLFTDEKYASILRSAGYDGEVESLTQRRAAEESQQGSGARSEAEPFAREDQKRHERRAARRLDELAAQSAGSEPGRVRRVRQAPSAPTWEALAGAPSTNQPSIRARAAAAAYMASTGRKYTQLTTYAPLNVERATRIAAAFEAMKHEPQKPEVKAAYRAMIEETLAQWKAIKKTGLRIQFIKEGQADPYGVNPRALFDDVEKSNHLWVYPTSLGFGSGEKLVGNPLLQQTGEVVDGRKVVANDIFRIVHDYFGHLKDGNGFRAGGEENAWRSHASMYSPLARRAMTVETRGQNSWVNFGPYGEANRVASAADTIYADQKIGLLPTWASEEGRQDVQSENTNDKPQQSPKPTDERARAARVGSEAAAREARDGGGVARALARVVPGDATKVGPNTPLVSFRQGAHPTAIVGIHYSTEQGLGTLNANMFGRGAKAEEAARIPTWSPLNKRAYFYVQRKNGELPPSEGIVGGPFVYRALVDNLYDFGTDPDNLIEKWRALKASAEFRTSGVHAMTLLEGMVLQAGYDGYINRTHMQGAAVVMGHDAVPVEGLGTRAQARVELQRSPKPFYSELERAITDAKINTAPPSAWKDYIRGRVGKGVKQAEIDDSGVNAWLDSQSGKVTKDQVAGYLAANGVKVEEKILGGVSEFKAHFGEWEEDTPDEEYFTENARANYLEQERAKIAESNDVPLAEVSDEDAMPAAVELAKNDYYDDPERQMYRNIEVEANGKTYKFIQSHSFGEQELFAPANQGNELDAAGGEAIEMPRPHRNGRQPDDAQIEAKIRSYLGKVLGIDFDSEGAPFSDYTLPGGKNYQVLLLTMPSTVTKEYTDSFGRLTKQHEPFFRSSHFEEANILAHIRTTERTDADGKKVLFIEEIQSDWAQKGKKEGFASEERDAEIKRFEAEKEAIENAAPGDKDAPRELIDRFTAVTDRLYKLRREQSAATPTAPFVQKTEAWVSLALRRAMVYAAQNGFERLAWTTGEQQADRYSLSKQVHSISWKWDADNEGKRVNILLAREERSITIFVNHKGVVGDAPVGDRLGNAMHGKRLEDILGKAAAEKINASENGRLEGEGLKIGGEGMIAFYDRIIPNVANDILKKLGGGRVGEVLLPNYEEGRRGKEPQPGIDITPELRAKLEQGQPLYSPKSAITGAILPQNWQAPELTQYDDVIRHLQDKLVDTKRVVEAIRTAGHQIADNVDPYLQEILYHGRAAKRVSNFAEIELRPLLQDMQARGITMQSYEDYAWAQHAAERNAQIAKVNPSMPDGGSGLTNQQAADILAGQPVTLHGRTIQIDPAKMAGYQALQARVDAITNKTLDTLVAYGLETQETVDAWRKAYQHYVPLKRDMESDANYAGAFNLGLGTGQGFSVKGSASRRAMGSERNVVDILANVAMQRERAIVRGEKNRIAQAVYGLAVKAPNPDFWIPLNPDLRSITKANELYAQWKAKEAEYNAKLAAGVNPNDPAMTSLELEWLGLRDQYNALIPKAKALQTKVEQELVRMGMNPADAKSIAREPTERYIDPRTGFVAHRLNPRLVSAPEVLALRVNGENRFVMFSNDERAKAMVSQLKNLNAETLSYVMQGAAHATRWFASINTQYNPVFGLVNGFRDTGSLVLNLNATPLAGQQAKVMKYAGAALKGIYTDLRAHRAGKQPTSIWAQRFEDMGLHGGQTGYRDMFQTSAARADALTKELKKLADGKMRYAKINENNPVFAWLSDYNTSIENAIRVSVYQAALDAGQSKAQAAKLAKEITVNFNKKGTASTNAGALYAFFNAAVQGTARMGATMLEHTGDPSKAGNLRLTKLGMKIVLGGLILGVIQGLLGAAAGWDDDQPPQFLREKNLMIPMPGGHYVSLPLPQGFLIFPNLGRITTEFALSGFKTPGKRLTSLFSVVMDAFNPVGSASSLLGMILPTVLDPLEALRSNEDWTGRKIAQEDFDKNHPSPGYTRTKDTATPWAKAVSYAINFISGGGKYGRGLASPTPDQIDYVIGTITGGTGREIAKVAQTVKAPITGEELPMYKIPVVGRFFGETTGTATTAAKFYENLEKIGAHDSPIKLMIADHKTELLQDYYKNHPEAKLVKAANEFQSRVAELNKERRRLVDTHADKARVQAIQERAKLVMQRFNGMVVERAAGR